MEETIHGRGFWLELGRDREGEHEVPHTGTQDHLTDADDDDGNNDLQ